MKVDGQNTSPFYFFNNETQQHKEATVKREQQSLSIFDLIQGKSSEKLTLNAGEGDDVIKVSKKGDDEYSVNINGQEFTLTKAEMENLTVNGGEGNDTIIVDASVDVAINVKGGKGDDTIVNLANGTTIDGGSGNNTLVNLGNDVTIKEQESSFIDFLFGRQAGQDTVIDFGKNTNPSAQWWNFGRNDLKASDD